jgi:hypothetical protein
MPSTIVTPWGHHLPDADLSRAAAERSLALRAVRAYRRSRPRQRRTATRPSGASTHQLATVAGSGDR